MNGMEKARTPKNSGYIKTNVYKLAQNISAWNLAECF